MLIGILPVSVSDNGERAESSIQVSRKDKRSRAYTQMLTCSATESAAEYLPTGLYLVSMVDVLEI